MSYSSKHVRRSAIVFAMQGSQFRASDISVMPLLNADFHDSLLAGLVDTDTAFTATLGNYSNNLTDFEMDDFEEVSHWTSECPPHEAMTLSSWTKVDSGESLLVANLPNVEHHKRQAWIDDDKTSIHVRAERVVPSQGVRCLPEQAQLTADGSHEVFEAATVLPPGIDFRRIVLRETDISLEFSFPADDSARDDVVEDVFAECPNYEQMQVADWKFLPTGEFELEATLPAVEPGQSKVQLSEDGTALHIHVWRLMTVHEDCVPEGTQTAISGDGQYEIFERAVLLPFQVDTARLLLVETQQGFKVTVPTLAGEDEDVIESVAANQSEVEEAVPDLEMSEGGGFDHQTTLDDLAPNSQDLCPSYHPLQVLPWRMKLVGFELVVALPGVDPEVIETSLDAGANRLRVRALRPVPREGRLCLPITSQVSGDGSQELFDILILIPQGSGVNFISEKFEHGIKVTVPFLGSPLQKGSGLSLAPSLDPPRKLVDILNDVLKSEEAKAVTEDWPSSLEENAVDEVSAQDTNHGHSSKDEEDAEMPMPNSCPEYQAMTSPDWQIADDRFVLDVTMPGVPPVLRKAEFTKDGQLRVVGFRSLSAGNLQCLPSRALTTVSLADGLQEVIDMTAAMPLGGDATQMEVFLTPSGLRLRMPIIVSGAESWSHHEV